MGARTPFAGGRSLPTLRASSSGPPRPFEACGCDGRRCPPCIPLARGGGSGRVARARDAPGCHLRGDTGHLHGRCRHLGTVQGPWGAAYTQLWGAPRARAASLLPLGSEAGVPPGRASPQSLARPWRVDVPQRPSQGPRRAAPAPVLPQGAPCVALRQRMDCAEAWESPRIGDRPVPGLCRVRALAPPEAGLRPWQAAWRVCGSPAHPSRPRPGGCLGNVGGWRLRAGCEANGGLG